MENDEHEKQIQWNNRPISQTIRQVHYHPNQTKTEKKRESPRQETLYKNICNFRSGQPWLHGAVLFECCGGVVQERHSCWLDVVCQVCDSFMVDFNVGYMMCCINFSQLLLASAVTIVFFTTVVCNCWCVECRFAFEDVQTYIVCRFLHVWIYIVYSIYVYMSYVCTILDILITCVHLYVIVYICMYMIYVYIYVYA